MMKKLGNLISRFSPFVHEISY